MRDRRGRRTMGYRWAPPCHGILRGSSPVWRRQERRVLRLCYLCPFPGPVWGRPHTRIRTASSHRFCGQTRRARSVVGVEGAPEGSSSSSAERNAPSCCSLAWNTHLIRDPISRLSTFFGQRDVCFYLCVYFQFGIFDDALPNTDYADTTRPPPPAPPPPLSSYFSLSTQMLIRDVTDSYLLFWCFLSRWLDRTAGTTAIHLLSGIFGGAIINNTLGTRSFMQANRTKTLFQQNSRFATLENERCHLCYNILAALPHFNTCQHWKSETAVLAIFTLKFVIVYILVVWSSRLVFLWLFISLPHYRLVQGFCA